MIIVRELAVSLGLNVNESEFFKGQLAADAVKKSLSVLVDVGKAAISTFLGMATQAANSGNEIKGTAQALGVTTDALQELRYAGEQANVGHEELAAGLQTLTRTMNAAKGGSEEASKVFSKIGVKIKGSDGKLRAADDTMADIADHLGSMDDGAEKTALSMQLFGKAGARMIPLLNEGSEGLARMRQEARDLGLVMSKQDIITAAEVNDNVEKLKAIWTGIKNAVGNTVMPQLLKISRGLIEWVKANRELIKQRLEVIMKGIAAAFEIVVNVGKLLVQNFDTIVRASVPVLAFLAALKMSALLAAAPFLVIGAAIAGLLLFLDDIQRYKEGRDSLFGDWAETLKSWQKPNPNDPWWLAALKDVVKWMEKALGLAEKLGLVNSSSDSYVLNEEEFKTRYGVASEAEKKYATGYGARDNLSLFDKMTGRSAPGAGIWESNAMMDQGPAIDGKFRTGDKLRLTQEGLRGSRMTPRYVPDEPGSGVLSQQFSTEPTFNIYVAPGQERNMAGEIVKTMSEENDKLWSDVASYGGGG